MQEFFVEPKSGSARAVQIQPLATQTQQSNEQLHRWIARYLGDDYLWKEHRGGIHITTPSGKQQVALPEDWLVIDPNGHALALTPAEFNRQYHTVTVAEQPADDSAKEQTSDQTDQADESAADTGASEAAGSETTPDQTEDAPEGRGTDEGEGEGEGEGESQQPEPDKGSAAKGGKAGKGK